MADIFGAVAGLILGILFLILGVLGGYLLYIATNSYVLGIIVAALLFGVLCALNFCLTLAIDWWPSVGPFGL